MLRHNEREFLGKNTCGWQFNKLHRCRGAQCAPVLEAMGLTVSALLIELQGSGEQCRNHCATQVTVIHEHCSIQTAVFPVKANVAIFDEAYKGLMLRRNQCVGLHQQLVHNRRYTNTPLGDGCCSGESCECTDRHNQCRKQLEKCKSPPPLCPIT